MALADILNTLQSSNDKLKEVCRDLAGSTGRERMKSWHESASRRDNALQLSEDSSCRFAAEAKVMQALSFKAAKSQSAAEAALKSLGKEIEAVAQEKFDLMESSQRREEHDQQSIRAFEQQLEEIKTALSEKAGHVEELRGRFQRLNEKKAAIEEEINEKERASKVAAEDMEAKREQLLILINQHQQHLALLESLPEKPAPTSAGAVALEELEGTLKELEEVIDVKREKLDQVDRICSAREAQLDVILRNCSSSI